RELARQYKRDGWRVIGSCRDKESQGELAADGIETRSLDLADAAVIERLAANLSGDPIDGLIANAGIYEGKSTSLASISPNYLQASFAVNAIAPILLAKLLRANVLASAERKMIAITSSFGSTTTNNIPGHVAYRSSKAALNAAWKGIAL